LKEFQIVDPHTRELRSHVSEILEEGKMLLGEQVKPEMIQSMVEVGTGICKDIKEARSDITNLRGILSGLVRTKSSEIVAAGTHPFSLWRAQKIFENARYELIAEENQMIARSLLTFGLHVHVGVADPDRAIHIMNAVRYMLPHVLALSTSSPFWLGVHGIEVLPLGSVHENAAYRYSRPLRVGQLVSTLCKTSRRDRLY
jgi:carboxylate-amine ligase